MRTRYTMEDVQQNKEKDNEVQNYYSLEMSNKKYFVAILLHYINKIEIE